MKQQTLTGFEKFGKTTRRAKFLSEMDRIMPWKELAGTVVQISRGDVEPSRVS